MKIWICVVFLIHRFERNFEIPLKQIAIVGNRLSENAVSSKNVHLVDCCSASDGSFSNSKKLAVVINNNYIIFIM